VDKRRKFFVPVSQRNDVLVIVSSEAVVNIYDETVGTWCQRACLDFEHNVTIES
jgi:hypothetical protein